VFEKGQLPKGWCRFGVLRLTTQTLVRPMGAAQVLVLILLWSVKGVKGETSSNETRVTTPLSYATHADAPPQRDTIPLIRTDVLRTNATAHPTTAMPARHDDPGKPRKAGMHTNQRRPARESTPHPYSDYHWWYHPGTDCTCPDCNLQVGILKAHGCRGSSDTPVPIDTCMSLLKRQCLARNGEWRCCLPTLVLPVNIVTPCTKGVKVQMYATQCCLKPRNVFVAT
jgi:hypothetical protein